MPLDKLYSSLSQFMSKTSPKTLHEWINELPKPNS